jgi:hypothetical protein
VDLFGVESRKLLTQLPEDLIITMYGILCCSYPFLQLPVNLDLLPSLVLLFLMVLGDLLTQLYNECLQLLPEGLNILILVPHFLIDPLLELHIIEEYLGVLLEPLILQHKPVFEHLALLQCHIPQLEELQLLLLELSLDMSEGVDLFVIGVARDHLPELLQLHALLLGEVFEGGYARAVL